MTENVAFFNCSSAGSRYASNSCPILPLGSHDSVLSGDLLSCAMIFQFQSPIPLEYLQVSYLALKWIQPKVERHKAGKIPRIVLPGTGSIVLLLLLVACVYMCRCFKKKGDDQVRLQKFFKDYEALKPTRFSYADMERITNSFKDKLGEGAHGTVFKVKLSTDIQVAVKVLNHSDNDEQDFINEMGTMGKIHHINVVRLLGFCADGFHRALVYDFFPNGSLQKFISLPDRKFPVMVEAVTNSS